MAPKGRQSNKKLEEVAREKLGQAAADIMGEFTGAGENPVERATAANQVSVVDLRAARCNRDCTQQPTPHLIAL
jgi:hypothetical protein